MVVLKHVCDVVGEEVYCGKCEKGHIGSVWGLILNGAQASECYNVDVFVLAEGAFCTFIPVELLVYIALFLSSDLFHGFKDAVVNVVGTFVGVKGTAGLVRHHMYCGFCELK